MKSRGEFLKLAGARASAWPLTAEKSKVFYTSLGYLTDFKTLLVNVIK